MMQNKDRSNLDRSEMAKILAFIGKLFLTVGFSLFVVSVGWWYLFYEQFLGAQVKQASKCFYRTTEWCQYGEIISVIGSIPAYSPYVLWAAAVTFLLGVLLLGLSSRDT